MVVYHGSTIEVIEPDIKYGRFNLDFGKGFYVTTLQKQSEKWAIRRAIVLEKKPIISVYEFDVSGLDIRSFDGYTEEWLDFVVENRSAIKPLIHKYDAIYGNIANDDVATVVDEYMDLLRRGFMIKEDKQFFLRRLRFEPPNNQYCIATEKGIKALEFVKSYGLEG